MERPIPPRRQFMAAIGNLASASWIAMNWPQIASAAEHAGHGDAPPPPTMITTLTAAEAADVDAIANQIVPGGATPGARDAHAIYFIDMKMPGGIDGIETMMEIRKVHPDASIIIVTAYATVDTAMRSVLAAM